MPSRQSWSNAIGSLPSTIKRSLTRSSISRNDMSGLTPGTSYVSKPPFAFGDGCSHAVRVMVKVSADIAPVSLLVRTSRRVGVLELELLLVEDRFLTDARELPGRDIGEVLVVTQC